MNKAIYAFSGDPITYGHINIVERASKVFADVIVAIGVNPSKDYAFTSSERVMMAKHSLSHLRNVSVTSFEGLLVDFAYEQDIAIIIRGIRNADDFNYENIMNFAGKSQKLGIDTYLLPADSNLTCVSSGMVKAIYNHNHGDIHEFVPLYVKQMIERKLSNQILIGVTGQIASGKSTFCETASKLCIGRSIHNIDLDVIAHDILSANRREPIYKKIRYQIGQIFGQELVLEDGNIDRKGLGKIVFRDKDCLAELNRLLRKPIFVRFRKELEDKRGIILVNSALLAEAEMLYLCNNNVVLVEVDEKDQWNRLLDRGLSRGQARVRIDCQYDFNGKMAEVLRAIKKSNYGNFLVYNSSEHGKNDRGGVESTLRELLKNIIGHTE